MKLKRHHFISAAPVKRDGAIRADHSHWEGVTDMNFGNLHLAEDAFVHFRDFSVDLLHESL